MTDLLDDIDFFLMQMEDSAHGDEGDKITALRRRIAKHQKNKPTPEDLGALLSGILHHYPDTPGGDRRGDVIYFEDDLFEVLDAIGLLSPEFTNRMTVSEWRKKRKS